MGLSFRYVVLSLYYVNLLFRYLDLSLCYVNLLFRYVDLSFCYVNLSFRYVGLSLCDIVFRYVVFYVVVWTNPSIISVTATPVGNYICRYKSEKPVS